MFRYGQQTLRIRKNIFGSVSKADQPDNGEIDLDYGLCQPLKPKKMKTISKKSKLKKMDL